MTAQDIIKIYNERHDQFELLKNTAYKIIYDQLKMRGIKFRLDERIKELNKLIEKSKKKGNG